MEIPFRMLDVFTDVPFAGNQLCVVAEVPSGVDADLMQTLAAEMGFVETTFVTAIRPDGYDVRIFTPVSELPFAGHPTLGTAFTLVCEGRVAARVTQRSAAGDIDVEIDVPAGRGSMRQMPPMFGPQVEDRASVARAAGLLEADLFDGLPVVAVSTGLSHLMVPCATRRH